MSNNKQSSLEWYIIERDNIEIQSHLGEISPIEYDAKLIKIEEQARAMHKEEMDKVAGDFWNEGASYMHDGQRKYNSFEKYYNETFGGNNEQ